MSHVKNVFVTFAVVMLLATFSSCTQIKAGLESPLPPPETLQLQADVMDSSNIGGKMVHFSWTPPDESSNIDLVVIEKAENLQGPWEEIAAARPHRGYYQEKGSIFRIGRIYYFRVFLTRGGDQTKPTKPMEVLITD
tara:strand:- start:3726 stop:4136 length:411 start_codon:yes stop_codon:yes gene_type:complete